ncbi:MAG TPA: DUF971 domain-containing protein [Terriglobia bacterium]|nr:DUF971 domain-containing protein [Terriglobia bacterium]
MAFTPKTVRLHGDGDTLIIEWSDGHRSAYSYRYLREQCPCATCTDAGSSLDHEPGQLPMLGVKPLKPNRAELVGRYALQIFWNDGHSTGIYTFEYLRELCPCAECESARDKIP